MNHSPEPWKVSKRREAPQDIVDANGEEIVEDDGDTECTTFFWKEGNRERIIACVNELASVPDALLESGAVKKLLDPLLETGLLLNAPVSIAGPQPQSTMLEAFLNYVRSHPARGVIDGASSRIGKLPPS